MPLRILSYNILAGGEDRLPLIANVIQKQQPDIVALLEVRSRSNAEVFAQHLGMNLVFGEANNMYHDNVVWLSRLPVINTQNHSDPVFAKTLLEIEILWEGMPLTSFATHLKAGLDQGSEQRRIAEVQAILGYMQQYGDRPHMLVGDLNTLHPADSPNITEYLTNASWEGKEHLPESDLHRQAIPPLLEAGYIDCYRSLHPTTPGYTYPSSAPSVRIDYIFASPTLAARLHGCDIVTGAEAAMASDHFPIWAEFR